MVPLFAWPHDLRVTNSQGLFKIAKVIDRNKDCFSKKTITKTDNLETTFEKCNNICIEYIFLIIFAYETLELAHPPHRFKLCRCSPTFILSAIIIIWRVRAARESGLCCTVTTTYAGHCLDWISLIWFTPLIDCNLFKNQNQNCCLTAHAYALQLICFLLQTIFTIIFNQLY